MQHWNEATRASYWARFKHTVRTRFVFFVSRTLLLKPEESLFFFPFSFLLGTERATTRLTREHFAGEELPWLTAGTTT